MTKAGNPKPPASPALQFRREIETAIAEGAQVKGMTLRLTLNDGRRLRRDDSVPLEQISYAGGAMHFLGVRVVEGGVNDSVLERSPEA